MQTTAMLTPEQVQARLEHQPAVSGDEGPLGQGIQIFAAPVGGLGTSQLTMGLG